MAKKKPLPKLQPIDPKRILPGAYIRTAGHIYRIIGQDGLKILVASETDSDTKYLDYLDALGKAEDDKDHDYIVASSLEELGKKLHERIDELPLPPEASISEENKKKAAKIIAIVEGFEKHLERTYAEQGGKVSITKELEWFLSQPHVLIGTTTYYKYSGIYHEAKGEKLRIANRFTGRITRGKIQMTNVQSHLLDMLLLRFAHIDVAEIRRIAASVLERTHGMWINLQACDDTPEDLVVELLDVKIPIEHILQNEEKSKKLIKTTVPKKQSFYNYANAFKFSPDLGQEYIDARYGPGTWEKHIMAFNSFVEKATAPLQYVFMDHCLIDVFVVDEESRETRKRLWLTVLIDAYTRCILGFTLLYEYPSIKSVFEAVKSACWPKTIHHELGIKGEWFGHGTPVFLSLDNAWAHDANDVSDLAKELGIDLKRRPPYKGRYGALIERYFGNVARKLKTRLKNAGGIPSSTPKDVGNAAETACLLYEDILEFLVELFVDYQNTPHSELNGQTPNQKWSKDAKENGIVAAPDYTRATERLFWRGMGVTRTVENGKPVNLLGMKYTSAAFRNRSHFNRAKGIPIQYTFRVNYDNISQVAVYDDYGQYCCDIHPNELKLPDGTYMKVTMAEREMAIDLAHQAGNRNVGKDWLMYHRKLSDTIKDRKEEQADKQRQEKASQKPSKNSRKKVNGETAQQSTIAASKKFWSGQ